MDNNEGDLDGLFYWSQVLSKVLEIENIDQVKKFSIEFGFTVEIETI